MTPSDTQASGRGPGSSSSYSSAQTSGALGEFAVRSAGQWFDMQVNTMRTLWETQARAAAAFGLPDYSGLLPGGNEERLRDVLSHSTERLVSTARRTSDAAAEIQRSIGNILESQAGTAADTWQQGLERLSEQTDQALDQLCRTAQQQAEQLARATESAADAVRKGMQAGDEQMRSAGREISQRGAQALSQMGEASRQNEPLRPQGEAARGSQQASNDEKQRREKASATG